MAANWLTNRGKLLVAAGDIDGAADIFVGLIEGTAVPATIDTEAEVQDINFVDTLLGLAGVDEPTVTGYVRTALTSVVATQDDTNNRVNIDADNVTMTSVAAGDDIIAGFFYKDGGGGDSTNEVISIFTLDVAVPTNGSNLQLTIADLIRGT